MNPNKTRCKTCGSMVTEDQIDANKEGCEECSHYVAADFFPIDYGIDDLLDDDCDFELV